MRSNFSDIFDFSTTDTLSEMSFPWSSYGMRSEDNSIKCHAYVADTSYCVRVNNLPAFTHLNRQVSTMRAINGHRASTIHKGKKELVTLWTYWK